MEFTCLEETRTDRMSQDLGPKKFLLRTSEEVKKIIILRSFEAKQASVEIIRLFRI